MPEAESCISRAVLPSKNEFACNGRMRQGTKFNIVQALSLILPMLRHDDHALWSKANLALELSRCVKHYLLFTWR